MQSKKDPEKFASIENDNKESKKWSNIYENASGKIDKLISKQADEFEEI